MTLHKSRLSLLQKDGVQNEDRRIKRWWWWRLVGHSADQGRPSPSETMMHFPPCFRFPPYFRNIFGLSDKFLQKILEFLPTKFLMTFFLVIDHKFRISPLFRCFSTFPLPPVSRKLFFPPTFTNFPPCLGKFTCILHNLRVFSPYFDHDVFMHHTMHVLDAPDSRRPCHKT